jgi:hypothetical protein
MRNALGALAFLVMLTALSGCENHDGNDWQRLVCDVQLVNTGNPLVSAYLNAGPDKITGTADDFQPIDSVQVVFHARPYGSTVILTEDGVYSWFQIESYDLEWEVDPGTPVDLTPHNIDGGNLDVMVPVNDEGAASVLIAGIDMKSSAWFVDVFTGDIAPFQANANITFYGHESGSSEMIEIPVGLRVHFIDVIIDS